MRTSLITVAAVLGKKPAAAIIYITWERIDERPRERRKGSMYPDEAIEDPRLD